VGHVEISVTDINDNAPKFSDIFLEAYVMENSAPGTLVTILQAEDGDEGENAEIEYTSAASDVPFFVDPVSGRVTVTSLVNLDRELRNSYSFLVLARDRGEPSLKSWANFTIRILDVDDHDPEFLDKETKELQISEDTVVGTVISKYDVKDLDEGDNAQPYFWISNYGG